MKKPFSVKGFILIVILLSWPFQIAYFFLGETYKPLLLFSMIMVGVATFICGKWVYKDGFANAGWSWGEPKYYFYSFLLALVLWAFPSIVENVLGVYQPLDALETGSIFSLFLLNILITVIPAFGEEFGWRGYLLPRLLKKYNLRKALLIHGFITWFWHLPFVIIMGLELGGNPMVSVPIVMAVSFVPTIMHAVVFAFIWSRSASLAVSTLYHVFFDEVRDTIESSIGLGILGQNWQMVLLTFLGILLLLKMKWKFPNDMQYAHKNF